MRKYRREPPSLPYHPPMRTTLEILAIALLLPAVASAQAVSNRLSTADIAAIRATSERWESAARDGRWADVAATFTDDAILRFPDAVYVGRAAILKYFQGLRPFDKTRKLHIDEIDGRGDMAFVMGHSTATPAGGGAPVVVGRYLDIRLKQPDGSWLFYRDVVNPVTLPPVATVAAAQTSDDPESRLRALGLSLPASNVPAGNYVSAARTGNLLFLATHGECGTSLTGKVGKDVSLENASASARRVGLCLLSTLKAELGDLQRVVRIVRVTGMVNAAPDFTDLPQVINGCSDLLVAVFGERGRHARGVVGVATMAGGRSVGIEMVVEVKN
jgi:ketosteroid isomerase-like protein